LPVVRRCCSAFRAKRRRSTRKPCVANP
jgi:hypothetical protein